MNEHVCMWYGSGFPAKCWLNWLDNFIIIFVGLSYSHKSTMFCVRPHTLVGSIHIIQPYFLVVKTYFPASYMKSIDSVCNDFCKHKCHHMLRLSHFVLYRKTIIPNSIFFVHSWIVFPFLFFLFILFGVFVPFMFKMKILWSPSKQSNNAFILHIFSSRSHENSCISQNEMMVRRYAYVK